MTFKDELAKNKLPIFLVMALMFVKFILIPFIDWQDTKFVTLDSTVEKYFKAENVLKKQSSNEARLRNLSNETQKIDSFSHLLQDEEVFKLNMQQSLEKMAALNKIQLQSSAWSEMQDYPQAGVIKYVLDATIQGGGYEVVLFLSHLESEEKIFVQHFNLDMQQHDTPLGRMKGKISLAYFAKVKSE